MAKQTTVQEKPVEKEYVIPLRKEWAKVPRYKRTARSVKAIKEFVARHMRVPERDTKKVKLDIYLNNELWFRGCKKPPSKIRIKARKESDGSVRVEFVETPKHIAYLKIRAEKRHQKVEKKEEKKDDKEKLEEKVEKPEEKGESEKTEEEKKEEKEKAAAVEQAQLKVAEQAAKAQKHLAKGDGPQVQRKALKK